MKTLRARIALVLLVLAASPVAAFASDAETETIWDWIVRLLQWTAGGWHHY